MNIKSFEEVTEFHGHACPGSALGYKVAEIAMKELSANTSVDEEIVAIVENDSCSVDSIQVVCGCTFGKGNLIFKDYGKGVYTFFNRNGDSESNKAIRISIKSDFDMNALDSELKGLREKAKKGLANNEEKALIKEKIANVCEKIINSDVNDIFNVEYVDVAIPEAATIYNTIICDKCGEGASENRIKELNGKKLCIPCFEKSKEY
ncbi:MAG: FmdE family protein [Methanobacteriaceae archaeon]